MNQGAFIVATLAAAFVLYLAKSNRLTAYAGVFVGQSPGTSSAPAASAPTTGINPPIISNDPAGLPTFQPNAPGLSVGP